MGKHKLPQTTNLQVIDLSFGPSLSSLCRQLCCAVGALLLSCDCKVDVLKAALILRLPEECLKNDQVSVFKEQTILSNLQSTGMLLLPLLFIRLPYNQLNQWFNYH